jgi:Rrf2 family cysteine metabolism transcriptional repressor
MLVSERLPQKCRYALRALFELTMRGTTEPVKIQNIASAQGIPPRFLEVILAELKHGGFVESRRGSYGGYFLSRPPNKLTVGEIIAFLRKGSSNIDRHGQHKTDTFGDYALSEMLKKVTNAISMIYDQTTFADLVERELAIRGEQVPNYII